MKSRNSFALCLLVTAFVIAAFGSSAVADVHYQMKTSTSEYEMMGKKVPASEMIVDGWLGDTLAFMSMDTSAILFNANNKKLYMINHPKKNYAVMELGNMEAMMKSMGADMEPEQYEMMKGMMEKMMGSLKFQVENTGEEKEINGYDCQKYNMTMTMMGQQIENEIWATTEVDFDPSLYFQMTMSTMASFPGIDEAMTELKKIEGFPVLTITTGNMMGAQMKTRSELVSIEKKDAPVGTYNLPKGYTEVSLADQ
jgi:hypothetical protein